jgi:hypothetical protein
VTRVDLEEVEGMCRLDDEGHYDPCFPGTTLRAMADELLLLRIVAAEARMWRLWHERGMRMGERCLLEALARYETAFPVQP